MYQTVLVPTPITEPTGGVASGDGSLEYALSGLLFTYCIVQTGSGAGWSHNTLYLHVVSSKNITYIPLTGVL